MIKKSYFYVRFFLFCVVLCYDKCMKRLDLFMVEQNISKSRSQAQDQIRNGDVCVNEKVITKTGFMLKGDEKVEVNNVCPFVSRAGKKLMGAIQDFGISLKDKVVLDIGCSTGGFTDCCLQNGAKKVYAVDVGSCQLCDKLKNDNRVVVMENTDIRTITKEMVFDINFIVCDVSFISLTKISSKISELLSLGDYFIVLIKPQFECGKTQAKKHKGIIKDEKLHKLAIDTVKNDFLLNNLKILDVKKSCILGGDGNTEFVALCKK